MAPRPFSSRRIAVRVVGSGPDVVLIPGLGSSPDVWNGLVQALPGYRWHLVHVRGFAGLEAGDNARGPLLQPLADEIGRYARESGLGAPPVIGHSMGGMLGMMIALARPAPLSRLMVVDMLPSGAAMVGGTTDGIGFLARQLQGYFTGTEAGRRAFATLLRDATPGGADSDPDVIADALAELADTDLGPRLSAIGVPLTVVPALPGERRLDAAALSRMEAAYRPVRTLDIEPIGPSGHMVMADQPARFAAVVGAFLGKK
jgi:pimeloyl-ACP methyl ester carboxylesterase